MRISGQLSVVCVLLALSSYAFADIGSSNNSTVISTFDTGNLSFGYYGTSWSGNTNNGTSANLVLPGVPIPVGATLDSATLTLNISSPSVNSASVGASRSEYDYQYYAGSYFVCVHRYFGGCNGYYQAYYYSGYGGSASLNANGSTETSFISSGPNSASLNTTGGTFDLLALGLGASLQNGDSVSISLGQYLDLGYNIYNYGYYAQTYYSGSYSYSADVTGEVDVTYTPAAAAPPARQPLFAAVPEPEAWLLFLTMAGGTIATVWFSSWNRNRGVDSPD
jgi:hypothetical protein